MTRYRVSSAAAALAAALLVAACGSSSNSSSKTSSAAAATTPASTASGLSIGAVKGSTGMYLTGASGRALYLWAADSGGRSSCMGACAKIWPPVTSSATPSAAGGVNAADLATITRADGTRQVTFKGHPLYYYAADTSAGTTRGQGSNSFGAKWWLVAPSGAAITAATSSSSSGSSSSGSSSGAYSSGGY